MKELSLYLHLPFCERKCKYCDFVSFACCDFEECYEKFCEYVNSLIKEIEIYGKKAEGYIIKTVYIGGGTPSVLPAEFINRIMGAVRANFILDGGCEITIEVNPNTVNEEKFAAYKSCGINRLSMGAQTMNDELLEKIGRSHSSKQFKRALALAKKYFDNINVDVMLGLPGQTKKDVSEILDYLFSKNIGHISMYSLILEEGTPLYKMVESGEICVPSEDFAVSLYDFGVSQMLKNGFLRYEVSNFSKSGFNCRHNLNYWKMGEYLGLGLAAHSFFEGVRFYNTSNLEAYTNNITNNKLPVETHEKLTGEELMQETLMLGLRTSDGVDIAQFDKVFGCNLLKDKETVIDSLLGQNLIRINDGCLVISDNALYVMDSIVLKLI